MFKNSSEALMDAQSRAWSSNIMHAGTGILMSIKYFFQKKYNFVKLSLALFVPIYTSWFLQFLILKIIFSIIISILW